MKEWTQLTREEFNAMEEVKTKKEYSGSKTIVKTLTPVLIPVISEAIVAATGMDKTAAYSTVSGIFGLIAGIRNWFLNHKK